MLFFPLNAKRVTMRFGLSRLPPFFDGGRHSPWFGGEDHSANVWLGDPILQWSISEITDRHWRERTYAILKQFLRLVRRERELLTYGQWTTLDWSTNDLRSIKAGSLSMKGGPTDMKRIGEKCTPGLQALFVRALTMPEETGHPLIVPLICLSAALRDYGVDVDPDEVFVRMFRAYQTSWLPMDGGKTIGTLGSEEGVIIMDEECMSGARVTMERGGCTAPWSITCGIYGSFLHTAFASSEAEGRAKYSDIKADLEKILAESNNEMRHAKMKQFADLY